VSLTTPGSLSEEVDDSLDAAVPSMAVAAGLRRSLTTDDAILMQHLIQPITAAV